jgi:hypothetical protein
MGSKHIAALCYGIVEFCTLNKLLEYLTCTENILSAMSVNVVGNVRSKMWKIF